jgi:hypothetical protein
MSEATAQSVTITVTDGSKTFKVTRELTHDRGTPPPIEKLLEAVVEDVKLELAPAALVAEEAAVPAEVPKPAPPKRTNSQRPGEPDRDYAKRLGYGPNDFGAPGYDPTKRDTTWDNYSVGDRYMDH